MCIQTLGYVVNFYAALLNIDDDIALVSSSFQQMDDKTKKLVTYASRTGLKINAKKTKLMRINNNKQRPIEVNGINIEDVEEFTYYCKEQQ